MTENENTNPTVAVLVGSVREARFGPVVGSWIAGRAREYGGFDVDVIDLAEIDIPLSLPGVSAKQAGENYPRPSSMRPSTERIAAADAFIVVTPEYNHSYPASLKAFIDWHYTQWAAKPVAFVSYGAASGGRHAVLHLENVLTELHAVPIRAGLAFPNYYLNWAEGVPLEPGADEYAKDMLVQLDWWARALRAARGAAPFPA